MKNVKTTLMTMCAGAMIASSATAGDLVINFDDPNPVVFTYVRNDNLYGEHETKTPLIHLMNWIERESDGRYTFNA